MDRLTKYLRDPRGAIGSPRRAHHHRRPRQPPQRLTQYLHRIVSAQYHVFGFDEIHTGQRRRRTGPIRRRDYDRLDVLPHQTPAKRVQ